MGGRIGRWAVTVLLLTLSACASEKGLAKSAPKAGNQYALDTSPLDCTGDRQTYTIDNIDLSFPVNLETREPIVALRPQVSLDKIFGKAESIRLIARDQFRDATAIMTDVFPQWSVGNYATLVRDKPVYKRVTKDRKDGPALDMLVPAKPGGAPYDLYFFETAQERVTTLISCPFVPTAVMPMTWCTLHKPDTVGIGYEITFWSGDRKQWRDIEALAKDIIADATTCGST